MPIGISTLCTFGKTFKALNLYADVAPPIIEIQDDWHDRLDSKRVKRLREFAASSGVRYTVHTPIVDVNIASASDPFRKLSVKLVTQSIKCAYDLGANLAVVHPGSTSPLDSFYPNSHWAYNISSLRKITSYAEDLGVTVAIENMAAHTNCFLQRPHEFRRLMDDGIYAKMTLDVGHAHTLSLLKEYVDKFKDQIAHVHIHDNMGEVDQHLAVGKGTIDWKWLGSRLSFTSIDGIIESLSLDDAVASLERSRHFFNS